MREAIFIRQNLRKWREVEEMLTSDEKPSPDELADIYTDTISDLSFARTHFPESRITAYLNHLSIQLHRSVYSHRREKLSRVLTFWTREVPLAVADARREMLVSLTVFLIAVAIGVISTLGDESFPRLILGDNYVEMTIDNIRNGTPTNVYNVGGESVSFVEIMLNNAKVSLMAFAMGLLTSLGTCYYLLQNGVMVGAFLTLFHQHGVFGPAFLAVMQHGTLELSTIVIEGGAGIVMGNGLLFPGTYSRLESFKRSAMRGLKIVLGTLPVVIVAAFIEGFITRHVEFPLWFRLAVVLLSAAFILYYYVVLPYRLTHHEQEATDTVQS